MGPQNSELRRYVEQGDEEAFRKLVSDYIGLVYGTARRRLKGDSALAADVTQVVFTDLARQAHKLDGGTMLGGWLHRHTCYVAAKANRAESRLKAREKTASELNTLMTERNEAWEKIAGELDEAVDELPQEERLAILLRFLEGRSLRAVGAALGVSDDAAQKRTQRALEKLRQLLERKRVVVSTMVLGVVLANNASATPVPIGLTVAVSGAALNNAVCHTPILTFLKAAFQSKLAAALGVAALLCGGGVFVARGFKPRTATGLAIVENVSDRARYEGIATGKSNGQEFLPKVAPGSELTAANDAIARLEAHRNDDEEGLVAALWEFFARYQTAPEAEKLSLTRAIPLIAELYDVKSERVRQVIVNGCIMIQPPTEQIIDIYLKALGTTNEMMNNHAIAGLMRSGPAAVKATRALIERLESNYGQNDKRPILSSSARMSLDALANIGAAATAAVPMLRGYLQDSNMMYRVIGARAFWHITGDSTAVLPVLTNALLKENSFWAADILAEMGAAAAPAIASLREAFRNGSPDARLGAYKALLAIDPGHPPDIEGIVELTETRNSITRLGAVQALWNYSHEPQMVVPLLVKLLPDRKDFDPDLKTILTMLGQMGPDATQALPAIRKLLEEPTGAMSSRVAASNTWAQISPGAAIPTANDR